MASSNGSDAFFGIQSGDTIYLRVDEREFSLPAVGVMYDQLNQPAYLGGTAQFYVSQATFERLTGTRDYDRLLVTAAQWDEPAVHGAGRPPAEPAGENGH